MDRGRAPNGIGHLMILFLFVIVCLFDFISFFLHRDFISQNYFFLWKSGLVISVFNIFYGTYSENQVLFL